MANKKMYQPRILRPSEFKSDNYPKETIKRIGEELSVIEKDIRIIDKVVIRAGFVLDTLLGNPPNDADLFYSLRKWQYKNWPGCQCQKIAKEITRLNLPIIKSRKIDLGHILKGEIYFSPVEKTVGPFSHHIDIAAMVCIDSKGNVWGNDEALYCINNRIGEIRYDGWLQHSYFPYTPEDPFYNNFSAFYALQVFRELRMIHSKKYKAVGPNLKLLIENSLPVFKYVLNDLDLIKYVKNKVAMKNSLMKIGDYEKSLNVANLPSGREYLKAIKFFL